MCGSFIPVKFTRMSGFVLLNYLLSFFIYITLVQTEGIFNNVNPGYNKTSSFFNLVFLAPDDLLHEDIYIHLLNLFCMISMHYI